MTTELAKTFDPAAIEQRWYAHWENNGLFRPERPGAEPFTIVNPPPNVTGSLHIGHALDNTLQDVVIRYERLRGKDALWVVGTDHAGIATQMVVERQLEERQDKRTNYSRDEFVDKVWEWKAESGGAITRQLRRLGCSMDWSREQFTMDPHFTKAVIKVFVDLYNDGLIYRDKRLVNWDPKLKTAISDLEVETKEVPGYFWHFKYPLADGVLTADGKDYLVVATTRPETMLADMAVAVHPTDERYASAIGKDILQPITGRRFKVVADEHADPELGSGVVKITPGHDFNDFEVGKRAGMKPGEMLNMFDAEARVVQTADGLVPEEFLGLDRFDARLLVIERIKQAGCLIPHAIEKDGERIEHDAEPRTIQQPFGDRGGVPIEPWLTDQWYVDAEKLAQKPIEAVKSGAVEIVPKSWEKTFFNWMENIQPWCVSRQLWWGHRIPACFGPDPKMGGLQLDYSPQTYQSSPESVFVASNEDEICSKAWLTYKANGWDPEAVRIHDSFAALQAATYESNFNPADIHLVRDQDVLDTWFSSALWPFATLGWPSEVPKAISGGVQAFAGSHAGGGQMSREAEIEFQKIANPLLAKHYPNDLLISGFDILFFWDARMLMMGAYNTGRMPWPRLYLHGLVRAADGAKMSKSKGNVIDPLGLIDKYGADALRFFMAAMESQGRDIKMDDKRVEGYRNFATKLWNATRFCQANGIGASDTLAAPAATLAVNKWIVGEVAECQAELDKAMAELRFDAAANAIYHFVWDRFCDWYLELIKPVLNPPQHGEGDHAQHGGGELPEAQNGEGSEQAEMPLHPDASRRGSPPRSGEDSAVETRAVAGWVLDQILVMLHPFMPFITEELWHAQGERPYELILAKWPQPGAGVDAEAKAEVEWLIRLVSGIRATRSELNVPPGAQLALHVVEPGPDSGLRISKNRATLERLARVKPADGAFSGAAAYVVSDGATYALPLEGVIDIEAEKARLAKTLEASRKEARSLEGRLSNRSFVEKAKPEAVEKARADHAHHTAEAARLEAALARLG